MKNNPTKIAKRKTIIETLRYYFPDDYLSFEVSVSDSGAWDIYYPEKFKGREDELTKAMKNFSPSWYIDTNNGGYVKV